MASAERAVVEEFPEFSSGWVSEISLSFNGDPHLDDAKWDLVMNTTISILPSYVLEKQKCFFFAKKLMIYDCCIIPHNYVIVLDNGMSSTCF
ncbi:hypothetical protein MANES_11G045132v8 [Manihot esculenta]|uniref:Uncharacterized protein n=1 Tax=Manihot esculenta TaxID=3983 RepID=A0ACB7GT10_MANES|nr:hypothetical protein MANES_11G045132v8 [Manihot esculenta]